VFLACGDAGGHDDILTDNGVRAAGSAGHAGGVAGEDGESEAAGGDAPPANQYPAANQCPAPISARRRSVAICRGDADGARAHAAAGSTAHRWSVRFEDRCQARSNTAQCRGIRTSADAHSLDLSAYAEYIEAVEPQPGRAEGCEHRQSRNGGVKEAVVAVWPGRSDFWAVEC